MCCKYLELLGPVTLLLSHFSEKSNEASLKIPDWCCQLCTVHFRKCSKWGNNFQSIFKYAAVKFFYQIIQSPFSEELCIFVCFAFVGGSFYIWIFINMHERMMYWWYCLLLLYHAKVHFFFSVTHTAYFSYIQAQINLFSWKPCVTWFHFIMYVQIFQILLQNASGPNLVIHW